MPEERGPGRITGIESSCLLEGEGMQEVISGIHNYCDRWCERCPYTTRCEAYRTEQQSMPEIGIGDGRDRPLWRRLQATFERTLALVEEIAHEEGIEISTGEEIGLEEAVEAQRIVSDPLIEAASTYAEMVGRWFETQPLTAQLGAAVAANDDRSDVDPDEPPQTLADAIAVIRWYQYQIATKIVRAVSGRELDGESDRNELTDADGSIKVALIGMDRSLAAWSALQRGVPAPHSRADTIAGHLEKLRRATEGSFPNARHFVRPGFDTIPFGQIN